MIGLANMNNEGCKSVLTDLVNWTVSSFSDWSEYWSNVYYGNVMFFVANPHTSTYYYSTDGVEWTKSSSPLIGDWTRFCYGNGVFVAIANSDIFAYSPDGINWTRSSLPYSPDEWTVFGYGNGVFVTAAKDFDVFLYSTDGINRAQSSLPCSAN